MCTQSIDVWQTSSDGFYDIQDPNQPEMNLRGLFTTGADGRFFFRTVKPSSYPIPTDGPVGKMLLAMAEDVLQTLASAAGLAGILVVTADPAADAIAARYGARVTGDGARADHTAAVAAAAQRLAAEGLDMLALPGDIPLVEPADIARLLAAQRPPPAFTA